MLGAMSNSELLHDLMLELRTPAVRDLAWALLSPALLAKTTSAQRHPLQASCWMQQPPQLADWLAQQDKDAGPCTPG